MDFTMGDFCLSCDGQTNGTAFCSSACRLTQLDHLVGSPASTSSSWSSVESIPIQVTTQRSSLASGSSATTTHSFSLPPAYDFSVHRTTSSNSLSLSLTSRPHSPKLSEQARNDLKDYVGSFDQTRTLRRKVSMQTNEDCRRSTKTQ
ncbi:hypothetical protein PV10_01036 [Exophiala mesophila]|uniref:Uncharacterized protein n=1 Tax=Exophiala mesophila TaxID=212818 RepID=A0A0D2AEC9_EXOME|nr:uncharacterized protein PV10_01036 [Exophiala mesophila]KIV97268.1 hypothetical protein PV10_01036 [Exophiala mesophila]